MSINIISKDRYFSGTQYIVKHRSDAIGLEMRFGIYIPDSAGMNRTPAIMYLSGFTGNHKTFIQMGVAQLAASKNSIVLISPDTSPRKSGQYEITEKYHIGASASFYVNATQEPWRKHWQMETYISQELPEIISKEFSIDTSRLGITGHCMGGLGALLLGLKYPEKFISVSAFSPICSPANSPWGREAYSEYFGDNPATWEYHDPLELITKNRYAKKILIEIGEEDEYLCDQLLVDEFVDKCVALNQDVIFRLHAGHNHSLHFVQTFVEDHILFHLENTKQERKGIG